MNIVDLRIVYALSIYPMMQPLHSMKVVARRTGLSPHRVRVWERRYGAVTPQRSKGNRRLYCDSEISRLLILQEVIRAGHTIGRVAKLSEADLRALLAQERALDGVPQKLLPDHSAGEIVHLGEALETIRNLDARGLEDVLNRAALDLGQLGLLQRVIVPLIEQIGSSWRDGTLKVAQEHVASAVLRALLVGLAHARELPDTAPRLIVTTPPGQCHELGALLAGATASNQGWRVTYLGACLPAEEIAGAAIQDKARAVALSLVYPEDDPHLEAELTRLRRLMPPGVALLAGGRAAVAYGDLLRRVEAVRLDSLVALQSKLDELRKAPRPRALRP